MGEHISPTDSMPTADLNGMAESGAEAVISIPAPPASRPLAPVMVLITMDTDPALYATTIVLVQAPSAIIIALAHIAVTTPRIMVLPKALLMALLMALRSAEAATPA